MALPSAFFGSSLSLSRLPGDRCHPVLTQHRTPFITFVLWRTTGHQQTTVRRNIETGHQGASVASDREEGSRNRDVERSSVHVNDIEMSRSGAARAFLGQKIQLATVV